MIVLHDQAGASLHLAPVDLQPLAKRGDFEDLAQRQFGRSCR